VSDLTSDLFAPGIADVGRAVDEPERGADEVGRDDALADDTGRDDSASKTIIFLDMQYLSINMPAFSKQYVTKDSQNG
jgi:hypothetical protein